MKIALFGKQFGPNFIASFREMLKILSEFHVEILIYKPFYDFLTKKMNIELSASGCFTGYSDLEKEIKFFFSIGGDGTFLKAITIVRDSGIPLVGINSGRLGFMADIAQNEIPKTLSDIFNHQYDFEELTLLQLSAPGLFEEFSYALNDFTVHKQDTASMITIHAYLNNEYLNSYWADGLIISTPTGSTAYSLSVGGPIMIPSTQNFIIAPISPHNLTVRPIVVSNNHEIILKVEGRGRNYLASLDSRLAVFDSSIEFKIKKADFKINVIKLKTHSFYATLRNKLMWGADRRN